MAADAVPVIDIGPFLDGSAEGKRRVAAEVASACEAIGFLVIAGHGVPKTLYQQAFALSREFFDLPTEEKMRYRPSEGMAPRGYAALASIGLARTIGEDTPPDLREQFYIGPLEPPPARLAAMPDALPFYQPNIWPQQPAAYRETFGALYRTLEALAGQMMRIFALALDLPESYFDDKIDAHFSTLPVNHYPAPRGDPLPGQLRAGAHTDFGSLTILGFDDAPGGLQVMVSDGEWRDLAPAPGHLVVNLGDMMARWTNDRWKSTLHRVVNPSDLAAAGWRQTIGYFLHPNYDAEITCIDSCQGPDNPPRYAPIMAGEQMRRKMVNRVV